MTEVHNQEAEQLSLYDPAILLHELWTTLATICTVDSIGLAMHRNPVPSGFAGIQQQDSAHTFSSRRAGAGACSLHETAPWGVVKLLGPRGVPPGGFGQVTCRQAVSATWRMHNLARPPGWLMTSGSMLKSTFVQQQSSSKKQEYREPCALPSLPPSSCWLPRWLLMPAATSPSHPPPMLRYVQNLMRKALEPCTPSRMLAVRSSADHKLTAALLQALAAFNQWSRMRRSLASSASSPVSLSCCLCPAKPI